MRIAIITNSYPPRMGGLEQHIENLAHGLAGLGHEVWVLTIAVQTGTREDDGVRVLTGRSHLPVAEVISFPGPGTTRALARFLREKHIDLVSTHTRFFPMSLVGLRAARRAGLPVIHTEHGSGFVTNPSPVISLGSRTVDLTAGRYVLSHAQKVLGVSPEAAAFATRLGAREAEVFYNAITPPPAGTTVDRPGHLVFVGRMVAGKGWDTFLDALAQLRADGLSVDGEVLGDGAELALARQRAAQLGLDEVVAVRGRVPQHEVQAALRGATLVNPTVLSEGFQTTLLESIAVEGRVVTFDVPGARLLREQGAPVTVCGERSTASLVRSLREVLEHPAPVAPPELIAPWTWPVRAQQYAQIAEQVVRDWHRG
ncbi:MULTISPECIES: glycosyltransferase family 4 protein [unclassified Actinomyces]|uniref:glycosyltransferase family 4 protein n=1 Tax=unclassified Actinomyces TaxID=2609248 RepID=UPI002016D6B7|nr:MULTISPECIES: glycosyltransferase family 4 protein [unclassified Actinomyces]MCL3777004.1 glycosyltransferase family 4 protein [Actinomyces sp. AC-20-1]MCL3789059.1 glycosyltransferase family 4 protein [Actinomyces sp. 187325]MCL3791427.1 glycosyltransferase family 4 protein [Actinomyces sp. 186855]MCL3794043.1 glycosyltransferase family 4 protein [Actinomyces sp. 217892]